MIRMLHIHCAGLSWQEVLAGVDEDAQIHLKSLIEGGTSGAVGTPYEGPAREFALQYGEPPADLDCLTFDQPRQDGYGTEPRRYHADGPKILWKEMDRAGIGCAVVGWIGTRHLNLRHGLVVSDRAFEVMGQDHSTWPVPPGSVHPAERAPGIEALRMHPRDLSEAELCDLLALESMTGLDETAIKVLAKVVCEMVCAHSVVTDALADETPYNLCSVCYSALEDLDRCLSASAVRIPDPVRRSLVGLKDQFIGRLLALVTPTTYILVTGGTEGEGFVILRGPGIEKDSLFPSDMEYCSIPTLITSLLVRARVALGSPDPDMIERFGSPDEWRKTLAARKIDPLPPTRAQREMTEALARKQSAARSRLADPNCDCR